MKIIKIDKKEVYRVPEELIKWYNSAIPSILRGQLNFFKNNRYYTIIIPYKIYKVGDKLPIKTSMDIKKIFEQTKDYPIVTNL